MIFIYIFLSSILLITPSLFAEEKSSHAEGHFDFYSSLLHQLGLKDDLIPIWSPLLSGLFTLFIVTVIGFIFCSSIAKEKDITPDGKPSLRSFTETVLDLVYGIAKDNCGPNFEKYLGLLGGLFIFILVCNLSGLVPGLPPASENMGANLAMGLTAFIVYNYAGIKEHGFSYVKQFMGPMIVLAPLFIFIELISHAARPLSLSLRLVGNIYADHLMLGLFTDLTKVIVPAVLLLFGLLVAVVQSFIFTLMTAIYISMAISHDH